MSRWLLALLLAAAGLPGAQARDALGAIDACLRQLDRNLDVGYQHLAARCPDLAPSLAQSEWAAWLPRDWNRPDSLLSADGLTELRTLLTGPPPPPAGARDPRPPPPAPANRALRRWPRCSPGSRNRMRRAAAGGRASSGGCAKYSRRRPSAQTRD